MACVLCTGQHGYRARASRFRVEQVPLELLVMNPKHERLAWCSNCEQSRDHLLLSVTTPALSPGQGCVVCVACACVCV
jgi:hypothetical protein